MGGSDNSASYSQTQYWSDLNYNQSLKSQQLQEQGLQLQKQANVNSEKGLKLQEQALSLSATANSLQSESLGVSKQSLAVSQESLAVSKEQLEMAKESQKLQKAQITEPEKMVNMAKNAADATARAQELRRGLGSTFSRTSFGTGKTSLPTSATSGKSTKLGG